MPTKRRHAFTLVELLVVISIIGALVALLLPAINAARRRAQLATCLNNQRNIAQAVVNFATSGKSVYPGWAQAQTVVIDPNNSSPAITGTYPSNPLMISWAAKILPQMDSQATWDALLTGRLNLSQIPRIASYLCPADAQLNDEVAHLTYVANTGAPDIPANPSDYAANGIFHNLIPGMNGPRVQATDVTDGLGTTMLISENIHKDDNPQVTWLMAPIWYNSGLVPAAGEQHYGMNWVYSSQNWQAPYDIQAPLNKVLNSAAGTYSSQGPAYARPASAHGTSFVVAMADGSAREVSQDIAYRVYQQLMTPNGAKCVWTLQPTINLSQAAPPFRNVGKQLSDGEY